MEKISKKIYQIFVAWFKPKYKFEYAEDLPSSIDANVVYLIGEKHEPWQAAFICPCGCNSLIQLSLLKDSRPRWAVSFSKGRINLNPSVHRAVDCKSHFYLENGQIQWVTNRYRSYK